MSDGDLRRRSSEIELAASDPYINEVLGEATTTDASPAPTSRFDQAEEFFIKLPRPVEVPAFAIHHDVRQRRPAHAYLENLRQVVEQLTEVVPSLLTSLTYLFDPADTLHPAFFHHYRLQGRDYLYLVKLSLRHRSRDIEIIERGTNDLTPRYRTNQLHLEPALIPLDSVNRRGDGFRSFTIRRTISQTWMGERGRGYFVQGIWMDDDLTKFFSRLLLPEGLRSYPYYPYVCKYRTVCLRLIDIRAVGRERALPVLHHVVEFLEPEMEQIQSSLRRTSFSEELPIYRELRARTPDTWLELWRSLTVRRYLNEQEMKEFQVALDGE